MNQFSFSAGFGSVSAELFRVCVGLQVQETFLLAWGRVASQGRISCRIRNGFGVDFK